MSTDYSLAAQPAAGAMVSPVPFAATAFEGQGSGFVARRRSSFLAPICLQLVATPRRLSYFEITRATDTTLTFDFL